MWFITVFEKVDTSAATGWPDFGCERTWGFYPEREQAVRALHENWTDMNETCYDYAVIEQYDTGISGYVRNSRQWFKFDLERNGYFEIEEPRGVKIINCFALG